MFKCSPLSRIIGWVSLTVALGATVGSCAEVQEGPVDIPAAVEEKYCIQDVALISNLLAETNALTSCISESACDRAIDTEEEGYFETWHLYADETSTVVLDADSEFDNLMQLALITEVTEQAVEAKVLVANDDRSADDARARIAATFEATQDYLLRLSSFGDEETGCYTIRTIRVGPDDPLPEPPDTGSVGVMVSSMGAAPATYTVTLNGAKAKSVAADGAAMYEGIVTGDYAVELSGLGDCLVNGDNPQNVTVNANQTTTVSVAVTCEEVAGECDPDNPNDCDDGKECTDDTCAGGSCDHEIVAGRACDYMGLSQGGLCNAQGQCEEAPENCPPGHCPDTGNDCTENLCDSSNGSCSPSNVEGACNDAPPGSNLGICSAGVCVGPCDGVDCDDGKECTDDTCAGGSCDHEIVAGRACDYMGLSQGGLCNAQGQCEEAPENCPPDHCPDTGNDCTENLCDSSNGSCSPSNVAGACEDAPPGDNPGNCSFGVCVGLCVGIDCTARNECEDDSDCDPNTGTCLPYPNKDCVDGNVCTVDSCDPATGCDFTTLEPDGTSCGVAKACLGGKCEDDPLDRILWSGTRDDSPIRCTDQTPCNLWGLGGFYFEFLDVNNSDIQQVLAGVFPEEDGWWWHAVIKDDHVGYDDIRWSLVSPKLPLGSTTWFYHGESGDGETFQARLPAELAANQVPVLLGFNLVRPGPADELQRIKVHLTANRDAKQVDLEVRFAPHPVGREPYVFNLTYALVPSHRVSRTGGHYKGEDLSGRVSVSLTGEQNPILQGFDLYYQQALHDYLIDELGVWLNPREDRLEIGFKKQYEDSDFTAEVWWVDLQ